VDGMREIIAHWLVFSGLKQPHLNRVPLVAIVATTKAKSKQMWYPKKAELLLFLEGKET
jgi:hypothetical protein